MNRAYYSATIAEFIKHGYDSILGVLVSNSDFAVETTQRDAWQEQIKILKEVLAKYNGNIYFEYTIPRLGGRIDVVLLIEHVIFILEFKVGEGGYERHAIEQVCDYALDLKNFHETSHAPAIVTPILVATNAEAHDLQVTHLGDDGLLSPLKCNTKTLSSAIDLVLQKTKEENINSSNWEKGNYCPTPTIIEAAKALYGGHKVSEISRNDAGATNLAETSESVANIIKLAEQKSRKVICFVTGVPGAGKTLVGLDIATKHIDNKSALYSVFLSGNAPLVDVLREALAQDRQRQEKEKGKTLPIGKARSEVKAFIQNIHHFRDDSIKSENPPIEHVVLFDEAQRTWDKATISAFMRRKKGKADFDMSEPEFLISCMDRHDKWAVIVCLVGGGQEIGKGESGIDGWIDALTERFPQWHVYMPSRLTESEYGSGRALSKLSSDRKTPMDELHLTASMRSFRSEKISSLVKQILDLEENAKATLNEIGKKYPIMLTRDFAKAKEWVRQKARGSERYGMVVSSNAERLKPYAIDVRPRIKPIHWFLKDKTDVRSSYYLEDVATEFEVQGLELDWACMAWDADFRYIDGQWQNHEFRGDRWQHVRQEARKIYQKNAYRVLLTRARQGMVIVVPEGDDNDHTRLPEFYNPTFDYLKSIGFQVI